MSLRTSDFEFELPGDLIAQEPSATRGHSRLLVVAEALRDATFVDLVDLVGPRPEVGFVVFRSADFDPPGNTPYYGSLRLRDARHPQALLAWEMNGQPLPVDHGAPLRLKVPTQLGYKSTKFIHRIEFVASLQGIGAGRGGYWEDWGYEHWAGI